MRNLAVALVGAALLSLALAACSPLATLNAVVPRGSFARASGIAYGPGPANKLDVYTPRASSVARAPVIVFFYGGSWQSGSREEMIFVGEALTSLGFVVVIPDYRMYPEVVYPAFVEDGAQAVEWTVRHIAEYGGDPGKLVLMGHSAGAHIAAMLAYNRRFLSPAARSSIVGFIGLAGPYDFTPSEPAIVALLSGEGDPGLAMPTRYVKGGEPRSLLITGDRDTRVDPANTAKLAQRLRDVGSPVEVSVYPGVGHPGILLRLSAPFRDKRLLGEVEHFVRHASSR